MTFFYLILILLPLLYLSVFSGVIAAENDLRLNSIFNWFFFFSTIISTVNIFNSKNTGYPIKTFLALPFDKKTIASELVISNSFKTINIGLFSFFLSYSYASSKVDLLLFMTVLVILVSVFCSVLSISFKIIINKSRWHFLSLIFINFTSFFFCYLLNFYEISEYYTVVLILMNSFFLMYILFKRLIVESLYMEYI